MAGRHSDGGIEAVASSEYATADEICRAARCDVVSPSRVVARSSLRVAALLVVLALVTFGAALVLVPWVQNVQGTGRVIAYSPNERQQKLTSPVDGIIHHWYVLEGSRVRKGDSIVDISDIDPDILTRLERERDATQTKLDAAQKALDTSRKNLERQKALFKQGLSSQRAAELAELEYAKYLSDISSASAELARLETRIARQASQAVVAPRDGIVQRIFAPQGGVMVKASQELALIIPETANRSVELKISGNDAPLVSPGRKVRLQFEGWPALQFAGWPSVAVGTFGGQVGVVDPGADENGNVRIIVFPDPDDEKVEDDRRKWPGAPYLRQGVRVVGWVLLDTVPLGWELWRQFNGFPASLKTPPVEIKKVVPSESKKESKDEFGGK